MLTGERRRQAPKNWPTQFDQHHAKAHSVGGVVAIYPSNTLHKRPYIRTQVSEEVDKNEQEMIALEKVERTWPSC